METKELIQALRADAEWAHANEWETPITLGDHLDAAADRLAAYEDTGLTPEELAALKEAAERIVLMWDNGYIEPYSADVKDYIENMRKAIKEADHADS